MKFKVGDSLKVKIDEPCAAPLKKGEIVKFKEDVRVFSCEVEDKNGSKWHVFKSQVSKIKKIK